MPKRGTAIGNKEANTYGLPFALRHEPVAECHPLREHEGRAGHVTLAHEVGIRLEAFVIDAHRVEHAHVLVGKALNRLGVGAPLNALEPERGEQRIGIQFDVVRVAGCVLY